MPEPDHLLVRQCFRTWEHSAHSWDGWWCNGVEAPQSAVRDNSVRLPIKSTPWWKIVQRIVYARQRNLPVRVQVFIDGSWRYAGQRR